MNIFNKVREFFWPLLEKGSTQQVENLAEQDISVDISHLPKILEYTLNCYYQEDERRKNIEDKASLFIGTISVVTSILLGVTSILVKENSFDIAIAILVFLLFILTLYMARAVWFSVKTLEKKNYFSISIDLFLINSTNETYYKQLISRVTHIIRKNTIIINNKVDNMTMAQEYFKRAIVIVAIYSFVIFLFFLSKSGIDFLDYAIIFIKALNQIKIGLLNTIMLYLISITSIILSIIAIKKNG